MKPKDEKKIARIYEVTPKLVIKKGLSGITMSDIAKEAKMAIGTLYIYFESKEELICAIFEASKKAAISSYLEGYNPAEPFQQGFKKLWLNMLKYRLDNFEESIFMEQCTHSLYINHSPKQLNMQQLQPLLCIIERGKKEKLIKDLDSITLLVLMFGGLGQLAKHIRYMQKGIESDVVETAFAICWDGMKSEPQAKPAPKARVANLSASGKGAV